MSSENPMIENRQLLTQSYCKQHKERLIFHPESTDEAAYIATQLLGMGFRYYKSEYRDQLADAVTGAIYLDTDKTIMVSDSRRSDGVICSIDHFEGFFVPEGETTVARIPQEEYRQRHMVFYPKSLAEARAIMGAFSKAGMEFEKDETLGFIPVTRAAMQGVAVKDGVVRFSPTVDDLRHAEICTAADLGVMARGALSAEQVMIMAAFNEMAARMQQMSERIARLEGEILPQDIPKNPAGGKLTPRKP